MHPLHSVHLVSYMKNNQGTHSHLIVGIIVITWTGESRVCLPWYQLSAGGRKCPVSSLLLRHLSPIPSPSRQPPPTTTNMSITPIISIISFFSFLFFSFLFFSFLFFSFFWFWKVLRVTMHASTTPTTYDWWTMSPLPSSPSPPLLLSPPSPTRNNQSLFTNIGLLICSSYYCWIHYDC